MPTSLFTRDQHSIPSDFKTTLRWDRVDYDSLIGIPGPLRSEVGQQLLLVHVRKPVHLQVSATRILDDPRD